MEKGEREIRGMEGEGWERRGKTLEWRGGEKG